MTSTDIGGDRKGQHVGDESDEDVMPSHVDGQLSLFDRFATATGTLVSKAWFLLASVVLVVAWHPPFCS